MHSKKHVIAAAPLVLSLAAFTQEALAVTDIADCRTISESGSYRLTENLSANGDCLVVNANLVEIDLRGHTIAGDGTGSGVRDQRGKPFAITVRNGTIATFEIGVNLSFTGGGVVEQLRVVGSGDFGILLRNGRVRSNVVAGDGTGIRLGTGVVADNFVSRVGTIGIEVGRGSTVIANSVSAAGSDGVSAGCPSRVADNSVFQFDTNKTDGVTGVAIRTIVDFCSLSGNASLPAFR